MSVQDPTKRFSSRVENYVKYRPHYPEEVVQILRDECPLSPEWQIADVGSGTGISAELFLKNGNPVFGVEPNKEMREAAERYLKDYPRFTSIDATAEATTLPDASIDMVAAGQAFHWFDRERARCEFGRILRPGGWVLLMWNERRTHASPFHVDYDALIERFASEYREVNHKLIDDAALSRFFSPGDYRMRSCYNSQSFDFESLKGRLLSSSYAPEPGNPVYEPMIAELTRIFEKHQQDGRVAVEYDTNIFFGQLAA